MSVVFDQLRVSDDGKRMYINVHINKADYFEDIYLDSITIQTYDKVSETNPNSPTSDYIYKEVFGDYEKSADLVLTPNDFNESYSSSTMGNTLFFVYIKIKGTLDECTPCRLDEEITVGVTFDTKLLYQRVMGYSRSLANDCSLPVGFTDFILLWNAFKASIETEHFIPAIKYYNMLFGIGTDGKAYGPYGKASGTINSRCGCHG